MFEVKKGMPLYEQIFEKIRESIITGEYKPGDRLVDYWVAEELGVSRSPVREAFRKLEQEGLLVNRDGNTSVYFPNAQDVLELFQVRVGLDGVAASLAAQLMTDEQLEDLRISLVQVEQALSEKRIADVVKLNTFFHAQIIQSSKNQYLQNMVDKIGTLTLLYRNTFFNKFYYGNDDFLQEHQEIYQALKSRDSALAQEKMQVHIQNDMDFLKSKLIDEGL
ncbi:GntR family transcriptional regulator [Brevibacillus nitrificans]|uniref:GntR family transcriptional regulator n=1 Tax=Brevibacillus nitrificans TaxID=651560 RepID=A0A3M8D394_9BACL|nr:GntR family transcriptional regulator [Brevibacillus nitrificans]MED1792806.1 GntR family transcriptional regulator [Brevibacillus nitrificans]RNB82550.1 GntR family transcriptional regulator [Brevibacillus nitrificans]